MISKAIKLTLISLMLIVAGMHELYANGCSGSQFSLTYSPFCGCFQLCGGSGNSLLISDCDELESLSINWGDGSPPFSFSVGGQFPCHNYAPGTYTAVMRVEGYCHNIFSTQVCNVPQTITVAPQNFVFEAHFTADTTCLGPGVTTFTNSSIIPPGILNLNYFYDFGDGTTSIGDANPVHHYNNCGAYDVMLVISGNQLCCNNTGRDTLIKRVYVNCPPNTNSNALGDTDSYIYESYASVTMNSVCLGDVTNFTLTKSDSINYWNYTFADGGSSTLQNPSHTYLYCPPFIPWMNIELTNTRGCTSNLLDTAIVYCPVIANFAGVTGTLCAGDCNGTASINTTGGTPPNNTILWNNGQTMPTAINLCPDTYSVTVTDTHGCWDTLSLNVFSPALFSGLITATDIDCFGWNTGTAVLTVSGGTPPNNFFWSPGGATTPVNSGLSPGTYCVTASDANGCSFTDCATINQATQILATTLGVNSACGACDGSATASATGGSGSYNYLWATTPTQASSIATNLCSGIYYVGVEDANVPGCAVQASVSIGNSGAEPVTLSSTDISCSNACDGTATASPSACPGCVNEWLDANGVTIGGNTITITGLCAGDYTARVTNPVTGCQSLLDFAINASNPVIAATTSIGISCIGLCDGQIAVAASGGSGNFSYQWLDINNNPVQGNTTTITALCPGTYYVVVLDQTSGCTASDTATVNDHFFNGSTTNALISCNGDCNASITVTAVGTNPPFTFTFLNSAGNPVGSGAIAANLCPDTYGITVTDTGGCILTLPPVVITQPSAIVPVTSSVNVLCFSECTGSASVSVTGGTPNPSYVYQWADSMLAPIQGLTLSTAAALCAGTYNVQVKDGNNCASPWIPVVVNEPPQLQDSMIITQPYCGNGGLGCIDLVVWGGTPGYGPFMWTGPNGFTASTEDICNIPSGQYPIVVTDGNGCVIADVADLITSPPLSVVSVSKIGWLEGGQVGRYDIRCYGDSSGAAIVSISGGVLPYTYDWTGPIILNIVKSATRDTARGLPAGVYNVTITDASGCIVDTIVNITQPPPFVASGVPVHINCYGAATGSIDVNAYGGVPQPPQGYVANWTYLTDTSIHITSIDTQLINLLAGDYEVVVRDSYVCSVRDTITILQPPAIDISFSIVNGACNGSGSGSIHSTVTGGTSPYALAWSVGGSADSLINLSPGNYILTVTDFNSCVKIDTAIVQEPVPLAAMISATLVTCFDGSDGSIQLTVTGGSPNYYYDWNLVTDTTEDLTGVPAGDYQVTVTDQGGCQIDRSVRVNEPLLPSNNISKTKCIGDSLLAGGSWQTSNGQYYDTLQTSLGCDSVLRTDLAFILNFLDTINPAICSYENFSIGGSQYNTTGIYIDTLTAIGGCDSIVWTDLLVYPEIGLYARPELDTFTVGEDEGVQIDILTNPGITIVDYYWDPLTWLNCIDCGQSAISVPEATTLYTITATDANNCQETATVTIIFDADATFYIPNAFTPNQDGVNDVFMVYGRGFAEFNLKVFDRWGELVFESFNQNTGWDGTYRGKLLNPGVFVYNVNVKFITGIAPPEYIRYKKGTVTLIR